MKSITTSFFAVCLCLYLCCWIPAKAQSQEAIRYPIQSDTVDSKIIQGSRLIKTYLPPDYVDTLRYPVIYTMDGEWMFELTVAHVHQLIEFEVIPPCIVVGVFHENRDADIGLNWDTGQFTPSSETFKQFLKNELCPLIDSRLATSGFNVLVGHSNSASYGHAMLVAEDQPFRGIISLSANLFGSMKAQFESFAKHDLRQKYYYFIASGWRDATDRLKSGLEMDSLFQQIDGAQLALAHQIYQADHNGIAARGIGDGLAHIFSDYQHYNDWDSELVDSLQAQGIGPLAFIQQHMDQMQQYYGIDFQVNQDDIVFLVSLAQNGQQLAEIEQFELQTMGMNKFFYHSYAQFYEFVKDYETAAEYWEKHFRTQYKPDHSFLAHRRMLGVLYRRLKDPKRAIAFAQKATERFPEYALEYHYMLAKMSADSGVNQALGQQALNYCQKHFQANEVFDLDDLEKIEF